VLSFGCAVGIIKLFRFVQRLPQLAQPAFAFRFRLCVQHWTGGRDSRSYHLIACISQASVPNDFRRSSGGGDKAGEQFADVELASGIA
jgi:hypothetical protein